MAETSIFDDDRTEPPDGVTPEDSDEQQVFPEWPVAAQEADEADVLDQARAAPLDEDSRD